MQSQEAPFPHLAERGGRLEVLGSLPQDEAADPPEGDEVKIDLTDLMNRTLEEMVFPAVEKEVDGRWLRQKAWAIAKGIIRRKLEGLSVSVVISSPEGERCEVKG